MKDALKLKPEIDADRLAAGCLMGTAGAGQSIASYKSAMIKHVDASARAGQ